ncbi:fibronectin type III domain-containing protein [Thauera humireducens]|uniref:Fibronectin type-III domain-containing protein n=1 Tax=Thauera humireducens TaxID=1134435 RepID=A0A127K456_9RHOO|nr:fibronectin type III domain-containing protein [Thauera humireducens]AMO36737.1 hypothetical protein AC731_007140 [Thauera humireducens]
MAQYYNDFTQYPLATKLDSGGHDFSVLLGRADYTFQVEEDARGASGRVLRIHRADLTGYTWWRWNAVPVTGSGEMYIEAIAGLAANTAIDARTGIVRLLCNANAGVTQGYLCADGAGGSSNVVPTIRRADSPSTTGASGTFYAFQTNRKRSYLLKWTDLGASVDLKYKTWWSDEAEPSTWTVETTSATMGGGAPYWADGVVGIGRHESGNIENRIAFIGVGTGTDSAPRVPSGGTAPTGTVTIGTITPSTTSASVPYSYSGSDATGFEYRLNGGTAASIGASPATISGLTASTPYSLEVRAINAAGSGSWSAVSNFTTEAEGPGNLPPSFDGPSIAAISATEGVALSSLDVSSRFSDAESALTFSAVGSWPAGVTVSSAGVISGTPTTAGTYSGLQVRATDAGALTADSNAFSITVAAAALPSTITVGSALYPIKYSSESVLNESGLRATVLDATTLAEVLNTSGVVCASGVITITDPALVTGSAYHLVVKTAAGWIGISDPVTAS